MILYYEWVTQSINDCLNNYDTLTYEECYTNAANSSEHTLDESQWWLDKFICMIGLHHGKPQTFDTYKELVFKSYNNLGKTIDEIHELHFGLISVRFDIIDIVKVYKNGKLYKELNRTTGSQPPTGIQSVHFANIFVTETNGNRDVIVTVDKWSYSYSWNELDERFKRIYVASLQMKNISVPDDLQQYIADTVDISNLYFDINLDNATLL